MKTDPLEEKPARSRLLQLIREGHLSPETGERAFRMSGFTPDERAWMFIAGRFLLYLGIVLLMAGIFFFVAYNWYSMGRFLKLGIVEAAIVGMILVVLVKGIDTLVGRICLLLLSILVGVWLIVYGQIYVTTADTYELFIVWTVFMVGLAVVSKFAFHWLLLLVLINAALIAFWIEIRYPVVGETAGIYLILFIINGGALIDWEWGTKRGVSWLFGRWIPWIIATAALWCLAAPAVMLVFVNSAGDIWQPVGSVLYAAGIGFFLWFYRYKVSDIVMLAIGLISVIVVITSVFIDMLIEYESLMFLVGLLVIVQSVAATAWLRKVSREVKAI